MVLARTAVVDTGPLYAAADRDDADHARSLTALERGDLNLVVPAMVVAETSYLAGERLGADAEAALLQGMGDLDVQLPTVDDWSRIGQLVLQYRDFPLGGVDASVVALAERFETPLVITLDRRHFGAIRPQHCDAFELLPD